MACLIVKKNISLPQCLVKPGMFTEMIETPKSFKIAAADFDNPVAIQAAFQAALLAGTATRIYLYPPFFNTENQTEAQVRAATSIKTSFVRNGKYRFLHQMDIDMTTHVAIATHRSTSGRIWYRDNEGNAWGTILSDGDMAGFSFSLLSPENMAPSDGTNPTLSGVFVELANPDEWNKRGAVLDGAFVDELERLADVEIATSGVLSATSVKVRVSTAADDISIEGLVAADFDLRTALGVAQVLTGAPYDANTELYDIQGTAHVDGTLGLKAPSVTTKPYETPVVITINIP
jgi:hypothetical protein